ncbi:hypothetical protein FY004_33605, partial [Streptomyces parvus]
MTAPRGPRAAAAAEGPRAAAGAEGPRAAFRQASGPRAVSRRASGPRARRLGLALIAAALLAGCATGTTEADPGAPDAPSA